MSRESATEVCQRAQSALSTSPIFELRDLRVDRAGAGLVIGGRVSSYYHKQLAQEVVLAVARSLEVDNDVDVDDPPVRPTGPGRYEVWTS